MTDETPDPKTDEAKTDAKPKKGANPLVSGGIAALGLSAKLGKSAGGAALKGLSRISVTNRMRIAVVLSGAITGGVVMSKISPGDKPKLADTKATAAKSAPPLSIPNASRTAPDTPPPPEDDSPQLDHSNTVQASPPGNDEPPPWNPVDRTNPNLAREPVEDPPLPIGAGIPEEPAALAATARGNALDSPPPPIIGTTQSDLSSELALGGDPPPVALEAESRLPVDLEVPPSPVTPASGAELAPQDAPPLLVSEPGGSPFETQPASPSAPENHPAGSATAIAASAAMGAGGAVLATGDSGMEASGHLSQPPPPVAAAVPLTIPAEAVPTFDPSAAPSTAASPESTPRSLPTIPPDMPSEAAISAPAATAAAGLAASSRINPESVQNVPISQPTSSDSTPSSLSTQSSNATANDPAAPAALLFPEEFESSGRANSQRPLTEISSDDLFASVDNDPPPTNRTIAPTRPAQNDIPPGDRIQSVTHVVRNGENFWTISRRYYGSGRYYKALWKFNDDVAANVEDLYVGTRLIVPPPEELDRRYVETPQRSSRAANTADPASVNQAPRDEGTTRTAVTANTGSAQDSAKVRTRVHVTLPNETLRSIARKELGDSRRAEELLKLNSDLVDGPGYLPEGIPLRVPDER